jgi:hypothetical protein
VAGLSRPVGGSAANISQPRPGGAFDSIGVKTGRLVARPSRGGVAGTRLAVIYWAQPPVADTVFPRRSVVCLSLTISAAQPNLCKFVAVRDGVSVSDRRRRPSVALSSPSSRRPKLKPRKSRRCPPAGLFVGLLRSLAERLTHVNVVSKAHAGGAGLITLARSPRDQHQPRFTSLLLGREGTAQRAART